eukprot:CAMPEP_0203754284 /NCGR_PEP_ID=MMETSP0098-20131031/7904_1 /ASSEMBLY_ACC=CAM_ASM_000208 /TAXON_ID=96639 /ORGANISM=" , Strain NY0313808BC1" /LENGTH=337 /DNA_ID=CAMNT_0050645211 /DNA_START=102 /DNA_END=1111 /DNA_ORIENTATION=-
MSIRVRKSIFGLPVLAFSTSSKGSLQQEDLEWVVQGEQISQQFVDGGQGEGKKRCTVAFDLGTTTSGFAYAMAGKDTLWVVKRKQQSCALFCKQTNKVVSFGEKARTMHQNIVALHFAGDEADESWKEKYHFFDQEKRTEKNMCERVLVQIIENMKDIALQKIVELEDERVLAQDILWVITVPCTWKESDKQQLRRAALCAGLIDEEFSSDLVIALESECTAISAIATIEKDKRSDELKQGDKILCLDCGGRTVDICGVRIRKQGNESQQLVKMDQVFPPTGLEIGGLDIDERFQEFLYQFLGEQAYSKLMDLPEARMELEQGWQRLKCSLKADDFR